MTLMQGNYAITLASVSQTRTLPIVLGQHLVTEKPDSPRMGLLCRLYDHLDPADRLRCHAEMLECRAARRGEREAVVL